MAALKPEKDEGESEGPLQKPSLLSLQNTVLKAVGVLLPVILVATCLRDSLTWQIARLWGMARDYVWQALWDQLVTKLGTDPFIYLYLGTTLVSSVVYWGVGCLFLFCDVTLKPEVLRQYKVQPGTNEPLDAEKLRRLLWTVMLNWFTINPVFSYCFFQLHLLRGVPDISVLPSFHRVLAELVVFLVVEEVVFYYSHWLLHHRRIYKHIHKKHHEWTASIALVAVYAHPVEHVVSNLLPVALGPLIVGAHPATMWLWFSIALLSTLNSHSGYHLPFLPSPEAHDFHHLKFNQCYGVLGVLDYLHGTDQQFRASKAYSRHITLLGSKPLRETFPDKIKE